MRILEVNTERGWRGGERQTLYTLEALWGKGVEVDLLCLKGTPLYQRVLRGGFKQDWGAECGGKGGSCHPAQILDHDSIRSVPTKKDTNQVEDDSTGGGCGSVRDQKPNEIERDGRIGKRNATKKTVRGQEARLGRSDVEDSVSKEANPRSACPAIGKIYGARSNLDAFIFLLINGRRYDLIHCQTSKAQTLAVLSKFFHRRPVVYTRRVDFKPSGFFTKVKYRLTDKVVAISERVKWIVAEAGLKPAQEIEIIASSVKERPLDIARALKLKEDLKISDRKVIATVGALVSHKDPFTMVEAIRLLSRKRDDFVFLHFGDGWLREEVEKQIRDHDLSDKYILVGFKEDVEDFFSIIDVFVMSSKEEGLGSVALDAFIYRVPVVSTDAGGLRETVEGRGIVCPTGDAACIAQGIEALLDNNDLRRRLGEKAYMDVKANYSVEKMADAYLRVFWSLESTKSKK